MSAVLRSRQRRSRGGVAGVARSFQSGEQRREVVRTTVCLGEMRLSAYTRDLRGPAKLRNEHQVHLCGGINPFDFSSDEAVCEVLSSHRAHGH